jgi:prophage regulatory protein
MTQLKLPRQADRKASDLTVSLSADLRLALEQYAALYKAAYGEEITLTELVPAILGEFLASDGVFASLDDTEVTARATPIASKVFDFPEASASAVSEKLIPLREVCHRVGVGKSMIYKMIQQDRFPAPYKPSPGAARWSEREVVEWIANIRKRASTRRAQ